MVAYGCKVCLKSRPLEKRAVSEGLDQRPHRRDRQLPSHLNPFCRDRTLGRILSLVMEHLGLHFVSWVRTPRIKLFSLAPAKYALSACGAKLAKFSAQVCFPKFKFTKKNFTAKKGDFNCGANSQADFIQNYFLSNFLKFP